MRGCDLRDSRIGTTIKAKNGLMATIIDYNGATDMRVQFEDGVVVEGVSYRHFMEGVIKHPTVNTFNVTAKNRLIGKTSVANNGMVITIIAYRSRYDFDIQFEDGVIITSHSGYTYFMSGRVAYPKVYVGETNKAKNGQIMTIIEYRSATDIDVQFEDGTIIRHKTYDSFKLGNIKNPNKPTVYKPNFKDRTGDHIFTKEGFDAVITEYIRYEEVIIRFSDGVQVKSDYTKFRSGRVRHPFPYTIGTVTLEKPAYVYENVGNFYCRCNKCKNADIMTIQEARDHICL